jgi:FMN phosphatase YigB (HAD superfamily)
MSNIQACCCRIPYAKNREIFQAKLRSASLFQLGILPSRAVCASLARRQTLFVGQTCQSRRFTPVTSMIQKKGIIFLFDVDNTLLDNDAVQANLKKHLAENYGNAARDRYWAILEELRTQLGYVDYLGALERFRLEEMHRPDVLRMSSWLVDYPFAQHLYPGALDAIMHVQRWGTAVILSDGDAVFQPRKVEKSGLWQAVDNHVLIYVHKEQELADVERLYPADHYVLIDDKLRILAAVKKIWGEKVTTVFVKQGHYAFDPKVLTEQPPADIVLDKIGDLTKFDLPKLLNASSL